MSDTLLELNVAWAKRYQDDITTLRAEVERLTWRVNNWRGCFEQQNERARKAEAERDAAIARAEKLEAEVAKVQNTLKYFQDSFCEGFCSDVPRGFTSPEMELDCSGCRARSALASLTEGEK